MHRFLMKHLLNKTGMTYYHFGSLTIFIFSWFLTIQFAYTNIKLKINVKIIKLKCFMLFRYNLRLAQALYGTGIHEKSKRNQVKHWTAHVKNVYGIHDTYI